MTDYRQKPNTPSQSHGNKKALVAAVSVICTLAVLIVVFLACKNPLCFALAKSKAEKNEFASAIELCETATGEKNDILGDYIALRLDINESYPQLLSEFDIGKINEWLEKSALINESSEMLGETLAAELLSLYQTLEQINSSYNQYLALRPEVLSVMEVFSEFNRLYTVGTDGKNTAFTVAEEFAKISRWEQQNANLSAYAATIPGSENIYLLNYLIKEIQGECSDLRDAMNSVLTMGYKETDNIRLSGMGQKKFPGIQNSNGESVTVLEKERYESFMFGGICRQLTENLGGFYSI